MALRHCAKAYSAIVNQLQLIVVNMPLSKENRKLLGNGFYEDLTADVASTIGSRAVFIDLSATGEWPMSYYHDSVHLNEKGGRRLNEHLAEAVMKTRGQPGLASHMEQ